MSASPKAGTGCAILFLLPFAAAGLGALGLAVTRVPDGDRGAVAVAGVLGVVFTAVGIGGMVLVLRGRAGYGELEVERGMLAFRSRRTLAAGEVRDIVLKKGMQSGNRIYWDLKAETADGKAVPLGSAVRDRRDAEWLVEKLRAALDGDSRG